VGVQIGNDIRSGFKQTESRNDPRKRIRHADTQCENDQSILDIISRLNSVIPVVEHLHEGTNKTSKQNHCSSYL